MYKYICNLYIKLVELGNILKKFDDPNPSYQIIINKLENIKMVKSTIWKGIHRLMVKKWNNNNNNNKFYKIN